MSVADRLQQALDASGLTANGLAVALGLARGTVYNILSGQTSAEKIQAQNALEIAEHLGVSVDWLIRGRGTMYAKPSAEQTAFLDVSTLIEAEKWATVSEYIDGKGPLPPAEKMHRIAAAYELLIREGGTLSETAKAEYLGLARGLPMPNEARSKRAKRA